MESSIQTSLKPIFNLLRITFIIVPVVAGLDKFTNFLTHWDLLVNPAFLKIIPFSASTFMMIVGVIEIAAGIIVLRNAEIGGYIVAGWLTVVALTLLAGFSNLDIAVRDLVLAISAFSMARISRFLSIYA
jgi:hypothetical protein